jgi:hypothetical protein
MASSPTDTAFGLSVARRSPAMPDIERIAAGSRRRHPSPSEPILAMVRAMSDWTPLREHLCEYIAAQLDHLILHDPDLQARHFCQLE